MSRRIRRAAEQRIGHASPAEPAAKPRRARPSAQPDGPELVRAHQAGNHQLRRDGVDESARTRHSSIAPMGRQALVQSRPGGSRQRPGRRSPNGTAAVAAQVHNANARLAAGHAPGLDEFPACQPRIGSRSVPPGIARATTPPSVATPVVRSERRGAARRPGTPMAIGAVARVDRRPDDVGCIFRPPWPRVPESSYSAHVHPR
jgi:hypothetical protein